MILLTRWSAAIPCIRTLITDSDAIAPLELPTQATNLRVDGVRYAIGELG